MNPSLPVVHAVTGEEILAQLDFVDQAAGVMRALGPRGAVHIRSASASGRRLFDIAAALVLLQESTGAWVIVNDRVDIALATGARAVQLTSRSLTPADARRAMGAARLATRPPAIGVSAHDAQEARAMAADGGATWIVVGHVFATPSHAGEPGRGPTLLRDVCATVTLPVIAIGGVRPGDVAGLLAAGAYGVAAIRGIWRTDDAERAAGEYLSAHDAVRDARIAADQQSGRSSPEAAGGSPGG